MWLPDSVSRHSISRFFLCDVTQAFPRIFFLLFDQEKTWSCQESFCGSIWPVVHSWCTFRSLCSSWSDCVNDRRGFLYAITVELVLVGIADSQISPSVLWNLVRVESKLRTSNPAGTAVGFTSLDIFAVIVVVYLTSFSWSRFGRRWRWRLGFVNISILFFRLGLGEEFEEFEGFRDLDSLSDHLWRLNGIYHGLVSCLRCMLHLSGIDAIGCVGRFGLRFGDFLLIRDVDLFSLCAWSNLFSLEQFLPP